MEVLIVLAVLGALIALSIEFTELLQDRVLRQRAHTELSVLGTALETYRREQGDYPQLSDPPALWLALAGRAAPDGRAIAGRPLLDVSQHRLAEENPQAPHNHLLDPWRQPYRYRYLPRPGGGHGYILYSAGPDGRVEPPDASGAYDERHLDNLDNVIIRR